MPFRPDEGYRGVSTQDWRIPDAPGGGEIIDSAMRQENAVVNAVDYLTRPAFQVDPNYDWKKEFSKRNISQDDSRYYTANSGAELDWRMSKVAQETHDKQVLAAGGWGGFVAGVGAGMLDPTVFIPVMAPARGFRAVTNAMKLALAASTLHEMPLYANQVTKTPGEAAWDITANTLLMGAIGGAIGHHIGKQRFLANAADDMARSPSGATISKLTGVGSEVRSTQIVPVAKNFSLDQFGIPGKEFRGENILSVTPESYPHITGGQSLTRDEVVMLARGRGHDGVAFSGFRDGEPAAIKGRWFMRADGMATNVPTQAEVATAPKGVLRMDDQAPDWLREGTGLDAEATVRQVLMSDKFGLVDRMRAAGIEAVDDVLKGTRGYLDPPKVKEPTDIPNFANEFVPLDESRIFDGGTPDNQPVAFGPGVTTVVHPEGQAEGAMGWFSGVGADVAQGAIEGGIKSIAPNWLGKKLGKRIMDWAVKWSPVLRTIQQDTFQTARNMMARLSTGGLRLEQHEAGKLVSEGGSAEDVIIQLQQHAYQAHQAVYDQYTAYAKRMQGKDRLGETDFMREVGMALHYNDKHQVPAGAEEIPEISQAAADARRLYFKPMDDLAREAGLYKGKQKLGTTSYGTILYDLKMIDTKPEVFRRLLIENFEQQFQTEWLSAHEAMKVSTAKTQLKINDIMHPDPVKLRDELEAEIEKLVNETSPEVQKEAKMIEDAYAKARAEKDPKVKEQLLNLARAMKGGSGKDYKAFVEKRAGLRSRIKGLTNNKLVRDRKRADMLDLISRNEQLNVRTVRNVMDRSRAFLNELDSLSEAAYKRRVKELANEVKSLQRINEKLAKLYKEEDLGAGAYAGQAANDASAAIRMKKIADLEERIKNLNEMDRPAMRQAIEERMNALAEHRAGIVERRALRNAEMRKMVEKLSPEEFDKIKGSLANAIKAEEFALRERFRQRGAEDVDTINGTINTRQLASELADEYIGKIIGNEWRLPNYDAAFSKERGSALMRMGQIEPKLMKDFLNTDVVDMINKHSRTIIPDATLKKMFGSVNMTDQFAEMLNEKNVKFDQIEAMGKLSKNALTPEEVARRQAKLIKTYNDAFRDLKAVLERARNMHSMPTDVRGQAQRIAKTLMELNVLRYMGMVAIASTNDVAAVIGKYGLLRSFRDGFLPFVTQAKQMKGNNALLRKLAIGTDAFTHTRSSQRFDQMQGIAFKSAPMQLIERVSKRYGIYALYDYWTDMMKKITGNVAIQQTLEHVGTLVTGKGNVKEAQAFLAQHGIDGATAERIMRYLQEPGGGERIQGNWMPNTDNWTEGFKDAELMQRMRDKKAFETALVAQVNNVILTHGWEKPLVADKNLMTKMLFQFHGFGMLSASRIVMAGLQQRDAKALNALIASMAIGAFQFYAYAELAGGGMRKRMEDAGLGEWADEAIDRSGALAFGGDFLRLAKAMPWLNDYITFGHRQTTKQKVTDPGDMLGPTWGYLADLYSIMQRLDAPTQAVGHKTEQLLPFQNNVVLRGLLTAVEKATGTRPDPAMLLPKKWRRQ